MCSTQPDVTDSVLQQPQQDSWTSMDHQYVNGEEETIAWGDTEVQMNRAHGTDQLGLFLEAGRESPEEAEQWEQIVWPAHPVTCAGAPLSFATVQWDMPDPSAATPSFRADGGVANEPSSGGSESLGTASPSLHQSQRVNADLFIRQGRVDRDEVDSRFLNFHRERTGNGSEVCTVCERRYKARCDVVLLFRVSSLSVRSLCLSTFRFPVSLTRSSLSADSEETWLGLL